MTIRAAISALFLAAAACATAQVRSAGPYVVPMETFSSGGGQSISTNYQAEVSFGGLAGLAFGTPDQTVRHGYIGQIYQVQSLALSAATSSVPEQGTRQISATATLDDDTTVDHIGIAATWSILSGPLLSISPSGLAAADTVYQNSTAVIAANWLGTEGSVELDVLDALPDNFGTYAGDGLTDGWQILHFGLDSTVAGPAHDPDSDGQDNLFEFLATSLPNNPASRFQLRVAPVTGQPNARRVLFSPYSANRVYSVLFSTHPGGPPDSWNELIAAPEGDLGSEHFFTDAHAVESAKFYRVRISE